MKADSYILQDDYEYNKWYHEKIDPVKTEYIKTEQNVNTKQDSRGG